MLRQSLGPEVSRVFSRAAVTTRGQCCWKDFKVLVFFFLISGISPSLFPFPVLQVARSKRCEQRPTPTSRPQYEAKSQFSWWRGAGKMLLWQGGRSSLLLSISPWSGLPETKTPVWTGVILQSLDPLTCLARPLSRYVYLTGWWV